MLHSSEALNILVTGPKSRALGFDSLGFRNLGLGLVNHTILHLCVFGRCESEYKYHECVKSFGLCCCQTSLLLTNKRQVSWLSGQWEAEIVSGVTSSPVRDSPAQSADTPRTLDTQPRPRQLHSGGSVLLTSLNTCYLSHPIMDIDRVNMMTSDSHGSLLNRVKESKRWTKFPHSMKVS